MPKFIVAMLAALLLLAACSQGGSDTTAMEQRISDLEKRVETLAKAQEANRKLFESELSGIRTNLSKALDQLAGLDLPDADTDEPVEGKAKKLAKESMEKLLNLSRDILDKLEQKLKELPEPEPDQAPEGKTQI